MVERRHMTVDRLRIYLFGEPRFEVGGANYEFRAPPRTLPLLVYLLLNRRGSLPREKVASALWPDSDQATAYANLRRHLHYLSRALPEIEGGPPWLTMTSKSVAWNAESTYWLDVEAFETEVQNRERRSHAVRLYAGDLYERCAEEWIEFERERLRTLELSALAQLAAEAQSRSSYVEALQYAQLMLATDPWREDALRTIMEIRMLLGDRAGALAEYERFAAKLHDELQTAPLGETTQAYERVRSSTDRGSVSAGALPASAAAALIGRKNESATLRDEWQRAARGEGRAVFVAGEAGIGKSTLLLHLCDDVERAGGSVFLGGAGSHEEPYAAFAGIAERIGADVFAPAANDDERLRRFERFAERLEERAREAPLLLAIEDLHWAAAATFELLRYLILRLRESPVLFVLTYREFAVGRTHPLRTIRRQLAKNHRCSTIALSTLSRDDVAALVASYGGHERSEGLVERIYERSGGNPLFAVELLREVQEGRGERVPASIVELVRERQRRLGEDARLVLTTAAIAGDCSSVEMLVQLTGLREADILRCLDELVGSHFLRPAADGDELIFAHELIREAVYEAAGEDTVRRIHARVGFTLRDLHAGRFNETAARAAHHFERGGIADAAAECYLIAAEHAQSVYALEEAATYARKAADGHSHAEARFRALRVLEFAAAALSRHDEQRAHLNEMLTLSDELGEEERAYALIRDVDFASAKPRAEHLLALERLQTFAAKAARYEAASLLRAGEYHLRSGEFRDAKHVLHRAIELLELGGEPESLIRALETLYAVSLETGDPLDELQELVERIRGQLDRSADARVTARLDFLRSAAVIDRDPETAGRIADDMLEHARFAGDVWLQALAHRSIAACATRSMRIGRAQRHLRRSEEITVAAGRLRDLAKVRVWQVMVENRAANFEAAYAFGHEGLEVARTGGAANLVPSIYGNMGSTAVWEGDGEKAERHLREALRLSEAHGQPQPSMRSLLGEVFIAKGALDEGLQAIEQSWKSSTPQYQLLGVHSVQQPLLLGLAYLAAGRDREARDCAATVASNLPAFRRYYVHPQAFLWSAAQLLRFTGYAEQAKEFARAARRRRKEVLATIDDDASRKAFRRFVFNRLIEADAEVGDPLQAWYLPYEAAAALNGK